MRNNTKVDPEALFAIKTWNKKGESSLVTAGEWEKAMEKKKAFTREQFMKELGYVPELEYKEWSKSGVPHWKLSSGEAKGAGATLAEIVKSPVTEVLNIHNLLEKLDAWTKGDLPSEEKLGTVIDAGLTALEVLPVGKIGKGLLKKLGEAGEIRVGDPAKAKVIRKLMQEEKKLREWVREGRKQDDIRDLLEGVWWHGRRNYPVAGGRFDASRVRRGAYFGEPTGISLSKDPRIAFKFDRTYGETLGNLKETGGLSEVTERAMRTMPLFEGRDPKDVILNLGTKEGHEVYKKAYSDVVRDFLVEHKDLFEGTQGLKEVMSGGSGAVFDYESFKHFVKTSPRLKEDVLGRDHSMDWVAATEFNERLTEKMKDWGYEGVLWNPLRGGGEAELKLFNPSKVLGIDERFKGISPGLTSTGVESAVREWEKRVGVESLSKWTNQTTGGTRSIEDMLSGEIDFAGIWDDVIGGNKARQLQEEVLGAELPSGMGLSIKAEDLPDDYIEYLDNLSEADMDEMPWEDFVKLMKGVK